MSGWIVALESRNRPSSQVHQETLAVALFSGIVLGGMCVIGPEFTPSADAALASSTFGHEYAPNTDAALVLGARSKSVPKIWPSDSRRSSYWKACTLVTDLYSEF